MKKTASILLVAASLLPLAFGGAYAASAERTPVPAACTETSARSASADVDCTPTSSIGNENLTSDVKADAYPGGPVNAGGGIWF